MHTVKQIDYKGAARRHFKDTELLRLQGRSENAGQLYGFNAECGLKAILVALGIGVDPKGDISRDYHKHMPNLGKLFLALDIFPNGKTAPMCIAHLKSLSNFDDWEISHRYWSTSALPTDSLPKWQQAAGEIEMMLDAAEIEELI
jgi:hypothetical protein